MIHKLISSSMGIYIFKTSGIFDWFGFSNKSKKSMESTKCFHKCIFQKDAFKAPLYFIDFMDLIDSGWLWNYLVENGLLFIISIHLVPFIINLSFRKVDYFHNWRNLFYCVIHISTFKSYYILFEKYVFCIYFSDVIIK